MARWSDSQKKNKYGQTRRIDDVSNLLEGQE